VNDVLLRADAISVRRGRRVVLERCDVTVRTGEVLGVYGPNGAGKSSLLQALAGLLPLASGQLSFKDRVLGQTLTPLDYHRATAAVFQEPLLLRGTVWHNVTLGLRLRGVAAHERDGRARQWLERLKIADLAERPVGGLSGGEAQRTSLARALVLDPEIMFLDEPFASLDAPTRFRLVGELADILAERRIAAVFVTHDLAEAADVCRRCLVLDRAHVLAEGELPQIIRQPHSRRIAEIVGTENIFEGTIVEGHSDGLSLEWSGQRLAISRGNLAPGRRVTFVVRHEDVLLGDPRIFAAPNTLHGRVSYVRRRGEMQLLGIQVGNPWIWQASAPPHEEYAPGQEIAITVPPAAIWVMPE
jgi:tungstate transport system ATP-binding protein